jgi:septal ring factor EnvC (AmiA/AmiB activator)
MHLNELKDGAIMLRIANDFLCEDQLLKKMGLMLEQSVEAVKAHVENTRNQIVGKVDERGNLDKKLETLAHIVAALKKGDRETQRKCAQGRLGRELSETVGSVIKEVAELDDMVEGKSVSYSRASSALGMLAGLKSVFNLMGSASRFVLRLVLVLMILCAATFAYLYFTMDTEEGLKKDIGGFQKAIAPSRAEISRIEEEMKDVKKEIDAMKKRELSGPEKIKYMELNVRFYKLSEDKGKLEGAISVQQRSIEEIQRRLQAVREKPFLDRLLRR